MAPLGGTRRSDPNPGRMTKQVLDGGERQVEYRSRGRAYARHLDPPVARPSGRLSSDAVSPYTRAGPDWTDGLPALSAEHNRLIACTHRSSWATTASWSARLRLRIDPGLQALRLCNRTDRVGGPT
jgi:hypothetical protein